MARRGWSASNYLKYAAAVLTAQPVSMACWAKTSVTSTQQWLMGCTAGATNYSNAFSMDISPTNHVRLGVADASASALQCSASINANTWFHACSTFGLNSQAIYQDGGSKVTGTFTDVPVGINSVHVGAIAGSSPFAPSGTGDIAEMAIWSAVLTDAEVLALSKGTSPLLIRPASLVAYWPLIGRYSPEINLKSNAALLSVQGTLTAAPHCRIILPRRRLVA